MIARWAGICAKCLAPFSPGEEIKPRYARDGHAPGGRPIWTKVPKSYVHAPRCPEGGVPRKPPRGVDPVTGEILEPAQRRLL